MWPTFPLPSGRSPYKVVRFTYLTTTQYPLEVIESIESGWLNTHGAFGASVTGREDFEFTWSLVAGELRLLLTTIPAPREDFESSWSIVGGTLRDILLSVTAPREEIESSWSLLNGTLTRILVTHEQPVPDELESSWSLISGTLT